MALKSITHDGIVLQGANADLWEVAQAHLGFSTSETSELARALGDRQDNLRVAASKKLIEVLWRRHPELGPYPFLDSLSEFEFDRVFYPLYRDHVCHQLKVYLLGVGVYHGCPRLQEGIARQLVDDGEFDVSWLVTSVFHDIGYVIEADRAGPGDPLWKKVEQGYAETMKAPLSTTGWISGLTASDETVRTKGFRIREIELGYQLDSRDDELFEMFRREADAAGMGNGRSRASAIQAYYDFAQKTTPSDRPRPFRDHGVASALLLMRHWRNYDHYIADWLDRLGKQSPRRADEISRLEQLEQVRKLVRDPIQRAAGAMSIHNVTPGQWSDKLEEAASHGLDLERFKISIDKDRDKRNGLAFLLGLVDTLQDWDRPTFGDTPKPGALRGEDLSIRTEGGVVRVHVASDAERFRKPATDAASRFVRMKNVLTSYLDRGDVEAIVAWEDDPDDMAARYPHAWATLRSALEAASPRLADNDAASLVASAFPAALPPTVADDGSGPNVVRGATTHETYDRIQDLFAGRPDGVELYSVIAIAEDPRDASRLPPRYPPIDGLSDRDAWFNDLVSWWQAPSSKLRDALNFTHGSNIMRRGIDQVDRAIEVLRNPARSGRAVIVLLDPAIHKIQSFERLPSFCLLQLELRRAGHELLLDVVAYFRHQEMRYWWPVNAAEMARIQVRVAKALAGTHRALRVGRLTTIATVARVDTSAPLVAVSEIDRMYDMAEDTLWNMAYALVHIEMRGHDRVRDHWIRVLDNLVPSAAIDALKAPVSVHGLEFLVTTLNRLRTYRDRPELKTVSRQLASLLARNRAHAAELAKGNKSQHEQWLKDAADLVDEIKAAFGADWPEKSDAR